MIPSSRKKVLVIDDEPEIRKILKKRLIDMGYDVHEAEDGQSGYLKYKNLRYDLLIVDVSMPKVSGPEFVKGIRERDAHTPILMLTACAEEHIIKRVIAYGISGWILKPFDVESLKEKITKILDPDKKSKDTP